jgi:catechol 2,3-dioxygenase-like lactoylglutathione lyase family enzyme
VSEFPVEEVELTILLVVSDVARSLDFYTDVLGAELFREYGGDSAVIRFQGSWLLLVTGGGPTAGKPTVTLAPSSRPRRGAQFLAPPVDRGERFEPSSGIRTGTYWRSGKWGDREAGSALPKLTSPLHRDYPTL